MLSMFALVFALSTPSADASTWGRDCAAEAEQEAMQCYTGWLGLSGCGAAQWNLGKYTTLPPTEDNPEDWGYSCDERARYIIEAHDVYRTNSVQDIDVDYAAQALDSTLGYCVDTGEWTCAQLARVSYYTEDFLGDVDYCDAEAIPVLRDFVDELDAAYVEQCIQDTSLADFALSFGE